MQRSSVTSLDGPAAVDSLKGVIIPQDYRGGLGVDLDNIRIQIVPEPGGPQLLAHP